MHKFRVTEITVKKTEGLIQKAHILFENSSQKRHFLLLPFWAFVWFAIFLGVLKIASDNYYAKAVDLFDRYDRKMIEWTFGAEFDDHLKIVLLGNSRLRHAFTAGTQEPETLVLPDGRKAVFLHFSYDAATFEDFKTITAPLLKEKPDFLIVQDGVISNSRRDTSFIRGLSASLLNYSKIRMAGHEPFDAWLLRRSHIMDTCYESFARNRIATQVEIMQKRDKHDLSPLNPSYKLAREFLHKAVNAEIPVAVLRIKSNESMLEDAGYPKDAVDFHGLEENPSKTDLLPEIRKNVFWMFYETPKGGDHYCDIVHLNKEGRAVFQSWLLDELAKLVPRDTK